MLGVLGVIGPYPTTCSGLSRIKANCLRMGLIRARSRIWDRPGGPMVVTAIGRWVVDQG